MFEDRFSVDRPLGQLGLKVVISYFATLAGPDMLNTLKSHMLWPNEY